MESGTHLSPLRMLINNNANDSGTVNLVSASLAVQHLILEIENFWKLTTRDRNRNHKLSRHENKSFLIII